MNAHVNPLMAGILNAHLPTAAPLAKEPDVIRSRIGTAANLHELRRLLKGVPQSPIGYTRIEGEFGNAVTLTLVDIEGRQTLCIHED